MGAKIEILIDEKPERVFHVLTDPDLSKQWLKGMVETIPVSGSLDQPGARFKQRFLQNGKWSEYEGHVTAFQSGRLFAAEIDNGPFLSCARYEVESTGAGTRLHYALEFRPKTFLAKPLVFIIGLMAKFACRQQVGDLKRFIEARKVSSSL